MTRLVIAIPAVDFTAANYAKKYFYYLLTKLFLISLRKLSILYEI